MRQRTGARLRVRPQPGGREIFTEGWQSVFESRSEPACSDRGLVLQSLDVPFEILREGDVCRLFVPTEFVEKASYQLWQYDQENVPPRPVGPRISPVLQNSIPGVLAYALVILVVAFLAGEGAFGKNWFMAGRVDGTLIRAGEWWRTITALTLHSGLRHFAGNLGFGVLFGIMAGRLIGSGMTWFVVVIASAAANLLNTLLLDSVHRAIGASTAVFAALGLIAGFAWRARLMAQDRWPYRIGPIVGGVALLAYTGTGDEQTDVGAHLLGFVCGFVAGMALTLIYHRVTGRTVQLVAGAAALGTIVFAWFMALRVAG